MDSKDREVGRRVWLVLALAIGLVLAGCATPPAGLPAAGISSPAPRSQVSSEAAAPQAPSATTTMTPTNNPWPPPTARGSATIPACLLTPIVAPTMAVDPGYTGLDETTGLHVTGEVQILDLATYRLKVTGLVDRPLSLSYDDLRCLPKVTATPRLVCPGYFIDETTWSGVPLKTILELAGLQGKATMITLRSADQYDAHVSLKDALQDENFLAYEWNGEPLPILHGFPLRAVFPSLQGSQWVKWLVEIEVE